MARTTFAPEPSVCIPWQDASCDCAVARRVPAKHVAAVTNAKASATVPETTRERKESCTTHVMLTRGSVEVKRRGFQLHGLTGTTS